MFSFEALQILVFLIPGFISTKILNGLIVREDDRELGKVTEALIFSLIIYTIHAAISLGNPISIQHSGESLSFSYNSFSLFVLLGLSIVLPLVFGFCVTTDCHMRLARRFSLTRKTARNSVWHDIFCDKKTHVIINFADGRRLYGWPEYYSNDPKHQYIYLCRPAWILFNEKTEKSSYVDLDINGILITPEQKIESIEFLNIYNKEGEDGKRQ